MRGIQDKRGRLFYEYIRILQDKKPKFFVAENVPGILSRTHIGEFERILQEFSKWGYKVKYKLLDARDYGVPQECKRVFIVGIRADLKQEFNFPIAEYAQNPAGSSSQQWRTLQETLARLPEARPALEKNYANLASDLSFPNHEYAIGGFSSIFMSRNRVKCWDEASFTIQASGRHAPLHPNSSKMRKVEKDRWKFIGDNPQYRRLSVRECARIQTFPDDFIFYYQKLEDAYRMIGNAVPVKLAEAIGMQILHQFNHGVKN
jgi:DNA (cytosine-5)-methyltransferase 1